MIGKTISHYRITEKLGVGGMGVVYKAIDTKLDRPVALKFLPPELTRDAHAKQRFIREAKAASALQHNNICTIHEIDETGDGHLFIAMDCYEGETLRERIARGPLAVEEVMDIAYQVAVGLVKAHEAGMIHRDIKPANIMLTSDGVVKIVDFGLAKLAGRTRVTKTGAVMGTIAYMSPEQATGDEVDYRSDVWSLGVVLYEMLTGEVPFEGEYDPAVIYGILHGEQAPLTRYRTDIADDLQKIINRALRKKPRERYQTMSEMMTDLAGIREQRLPAGSHRRTAKRGRRAGIVAAVTVIMIIAGSFAYTSFFMNREGAGDERTRIAVLPFENLGPAEDEYFADGVTEEITARLAALRELAVIARTSAKQYKFTSKSIGQIGEELGVDYVMEGTVRWQRGMRGDNKIRVTPQLIRVVDATHLWADIYEKPVTEIFEVQADIASKVVEALGIALLKNERTLLESVPTDDFDAYTHYLHGRSFQTRSYTESDLQQAEQAFEHAIALDPEFTLAYARLAQVHCEIYWQWHDRSAERVELARRAAEKALELEPDLAEAHMAMGDYFYTCRLDYDNALAHYQIAERNSPNNAELAAAIGYVQRRQGEWPKAAENLTRASELDPRSALQAAEAGYTFIFLRDYATAERYFKRAIALDPTVPAFSIWTAELYFVWDGTTIRADSILHKALEYVDDPDIISVFMLFIDMYEGEYEKALKRLSPVSSQDLWKTESAAVSSTVTALYYAEIYDLMGNQDLAYEYYDSALVNLENRIIEAPDEPKFHADLGIALAGLGRRDEAIRQGKRGIELMPLTKEAMKGYSMRCTLARIYTMVGDYESAIEELDFLLSIPGYLSTGMLRLDPVWRPLHGKDSFQRLLEKYETKKTEK